MSALEIAIDRVNEYDRVMQRQQGAQDSDRCDDHLLLGVQSFLWIKRAQSDAVQRAVRNEVSAEEACGYVEMLYHLWLRVCEESLLGARQLQAKGFSVEHLGEILKLRDEALAYLRASEVESMCDKGILLSPANAAALDAVLHNPSATDART